MTPRALPGCLPRVQTPARPSPEPRVTRANPDVTRESLVPADAATLAATMTGVDVAVVCTGFVPGNPFKMAAAAHAVDNEGVVHLVVRARGWSRKEGGDPTPPRRPFRFCRAHPRRGLSTASHIV